MKVSAILYAPNFDNDKRELTVLAGRSARSHLTIVRDEHGWYCVNTRTSLRGYHDTPEDAATEAAMRCYLHTTSVELDVRA